MSGAMTVQAQGWCVTVPAGSYFLGDPCYAVPVAMWDALLASCDVFELPVGTVAGVQVLAFGTRWGDGEYSDGQGGTYPVDAGLIGLTPISLASQNPNFEALPTLGRMVNFLTPTQCTCDAAGRLTFGQFCINTDA